MAQKVQIQLIDDITDEAADETVEFSLDGVNFEIDLTTANAEKLREALAPYVAAGRRISGSGRRGRGPRVQRSNRTKEMRAWAAENGYKISSRGRVSAEIQEAFDKAHS